MSLSPGKLKHLKALSNKDGIIAAAAMDQRGSLQKSIASAKGVDKSAITDEMMQEFKVAVSKILTPHASAILLDPEWGLPAAKARASNAGLLLAYEESGYDNTKPGRLPDLLPHVSAKRIADWGANAVKILLYYSPWDHAGVNDINEIWPGFTTNDSGIGNGNARNDGIAASTAVSVVVHAPGGAKIACADLE